MAKQDIVGGTSGAVVAAGFNLDIGEWSGEITQNTVRYRTFSSEWMKSKGVSMQMQGSFQGTIQFNDANTAPMPVTGGVINPSAFKGVSMALTAETGCDYTGTANIVGVNLRRVATDRMTGTFRYELDGAASQAWDETP